MPNQSKKHKEIEPEHLELMQKIGIRIKELRKDKKKSYIEMAEAIGISRNEYNLLELGKIYFKFSTLLKVLDYYKINLIDFTNSI